MVVSKDTKDDGDHACAAEEANLVAKPHDGEEDEERTLDGVCHALGHWGEQAHGEIRRHALQVVEHCVNEDHDPDVAGYACVSELEL